MRPTFGREYIENEFQRIADGLSEPLTVYLIGGGAMSLRDLKGATKDIDLVVSDGDVYGQLWAVLMDLGYAEVQSLDPDYRALGATSCVENDDGCRLDIFNQQVANKLVLNGGMQERSEPFLDTDQLTVQLVSNEDIFLFKLIAGRDDDIEDMNMLVQAGLDYDVVRDGLEAHIEPLGDDQFATFANEALVELSALVVEFTSRKELCGTCEGNLVETEANAENRSGLGRLVSGPGLAKAEVQVALTIAVMESGFRGNRATDEENKSAASEGGGGFSGAFKHQ